MKLAWDRTSMWTFVSDQKKPGKPEEGKEIHCQHKNIVEPVFGQIKFNLGFTRFCLRGLSKLGGEWILVCLVHNIKKIYARITAKGGELDDLTRKLQTAHNPA